MKVGLRLGATLVFTLKVRFTEEILTRLTPHENQQTTTSQEISFNKKDSNKRHGRQTKPMGNM